MILIKKRLKKQTIKQYEKVLMVEMYYFLNYYFKFPLIESYFY